MRLFKATQRTITISHDGIVWTKVVMQNVDEMNDNRLTRKQCAMQCSAIEFHIQRYVDIDRHFNTDNDNDNDNDNESDKVTLICWIFWISKM